MKFKLEKIKIQPNLFVILTFIFIITTAILGVEDIRLVNQNANQKAYIDSSKSTTPIAIYQPQPTPEGTLSNYGSRRLLWTKDENYIPELIIRDDKTRAETLLMKNPPQGIDWHGSAWSPDGQYVYVTLDNVNNEGDSVWIFKTDGTNFNSGKDYVSSEDLGLISSHIFSVNWVGGGGFIGNVVYINDAPINSIKNSYIDMDQKTILLTPNIPSGHALD